MPEASLDTWTSIFFVVSIFGVFFSSLFLLKGRHRLLSVWPIPVLILGFSIVLFQYSLYWTGYLLEYPFLNFTVSAWFLSFGPLLYLYTAKFCKISPKRIFLHFVPAFISLLLSFAYYLQFYGLPMFGRDSFVLEFLVYSNNHWLATGSMSIYLILSIIVWNRFKWKSTQRIVNNWMSLLQVSFGIFILSYTSYYILIQFPFFNVNWDYGIAIGMSISVFTIGLFVYYEPALFNGELKWTMKEESQTEFTDDTSKQFYSKIVALVTQDELYLNGDLRLAHVSDALGLSLHDASRIINVHSGKNFNQFINDFRVERAQELLTTTQLSVKEICFISGFNSKVSFYAAFKSKTNKTPSEYRKSSPLGA